MCFRSCSRFDALKAENDELTDTVDRLKAQGGGGGHDDSLSMDDKEAQAALGPLLPPWCRIIRSPVARIASTSRARWSAADVHCFSSWRRIALTYSSNQRCSASA